MHEALLSVLIADDEYWIRESLRTALDWPAYGMSFLEPVCDGEEALTALKSRHVDILITDINMPYLSGVELIRQAQSVSPQTAILVLSGYSDYEYVRQALLAGALDYLLKPISKASLLEALDKAIDKMLERQREERDRTELQKKLSAAASAMLDRDFSELLHAARHQAQVQDVEAQLFEYEQRFSGYRLTLLDVPGASTANGAAIKELLEETISLRPRLIIRNLYHLTHYLLITPTDAGALSETLAAVAQALLKHTGSPARAVISEACLSFGDLRKVYNETRTVLLTLPMRPGSEVVFAARQERRPLSQRLSPALQKQMEQAVRMQQRDWFDRLVEQTGLWSPQAQEWPQREYLHCVTAIAWVLHLEELDAVIATLEENGIIPFASHMVDTWSIGNVTMQFAVNDVFNKYPTWGDMFRAGEVSFATSEEYKACYEYNKLIYDHTWTDETFSTEQTACDARMVMGEAAMKVSGSWSIQNFLDIDENYDFGIFPFPNQTGDAKLLFEPNITFMASAQSEYQDAIDKVFEVIATDAALQQEIYDYTKTAPMVKGVTPTFPNPSQTDIDAYAAEGMIQDVNLGNNQLVWGGFQEENAKDIAEYLQGNITIEEALNAADARRDNSK